MNDSLSTNEYVNDILHQPEALRNTVAGFQELDLGRIREFGGRLSAGSLERVVLTGMGSSLHALHPLRLALIGHGIQADMWETSELIHFAPGLLSPEALLVVVSQSGRSIEMLQMLDLVPEETPVVGITNTPDSPLARRAGAVLVTRAGSEHSVTCKTYVAALAALSLIGDVLIGRDPASTLSACRAAADRMAAYLSRWEAHVEHAIREMGGVRDMMLVGRGASLAAAETGGLIIKEAAHVHAEGMSSAAFRHGPFEMTGPELLVLVYSGTGPSRQLNINLAADIRKAGGRAELVAQREDHGIYNLPPVPDAQLPLLEVLPAQLISVALAVLNRHTPGQFERGTKVTEVA